MYESEGESMRYLTKEWYGLSQCTGLHFGMRAHKGAGQKDEALYLRLYKRKEREFIKKEHEIYNVNPRYMLDVAGSVFIPADKFLSDDEICEEDKIVYEMPSEEKERIYRLIEEYDSREPFDVNEYRIKFSKIQDILSRDNAEKLPEELYSQIADHRVFTLGYCTKEILKQLKSYSIKNNKKVHNALEEYTKAQQEQDIPEELKKQFGFHDCVVVNCKVDRDVEISFNSSNGFSEFKKVVFQDAKIIKQEKSLEGSIWLYEELYCSQNGYEAHILFASDLSHELTISCKDIILGKG